MKRTVSRERKLVAFTISIGDLEVLWGRLSELFEEIEAAKGQVVIRLPSEELRFDGTEELRQYKPLKRRLTGFRFTMSGASDDHGYRELSINSNSYSRSTVSAEGDSDVWCATAVEEVTAFMLNHKSWYGWMHSTPMGTLLWLLIVIPTNAYILRSTIWDIKISAGFIVAWGILTSLFLMLYLAKSFLLPPAILVVSDEGEFIKKRGAELSLILAILSLIATLVGILWPRN